MFQNELTSHTSSSFSKAMMFPFSSKSVFGGRPHQTKKQKKKTTTRNKKKRFHKIQLWKSNSLQEASQYWESNVSGKFSKEEKILWAKQLFCFVWQAQGKEAALSFQPNRQLADHQFDRGCQLWVEKQYPQALWEIQTSMATQETVSSFSDSSSFDDVKAKVQSHYALGMVHLSLENYALAICQFCQSWRSSVLQYHDNIETPKELSVLLQASKYMMRKALASSFGVMGAHLQMARIQKALNYELEGDFFHALGDYEMALEYFQMALHEISLSGHPQEENHHFMYLQANLRCKLAKLYEAQDHFENVGDIVQDNLELAGEEWATALCLYQTLLGLEHSTTMSTQKSFTDNHSAILHRRRMQHEEQVYEI